VTSKRLTLRPVLRYTAGVKSRLARTIGFLALVFAGGTIGYRLIEHANWWDSFYMTAITLTTVGYREVFPLSHTGEVFTVVLLFAGLGLILLVAMEIGRTVLEGELREIFGQARRSRMIESLSRHEILCGFGRMGQAVLEELRRSRRTVVVIESKPDKVQRLKELNVPVVAGDATTEAALRAAGIEYARGLVACLNDDAHNVYTVLTARSLNPDLFIVARAGEEGADARLLRAGANRVVSPYRHGGVRLAHVLMKPTVVDFLDISLRPGSDTSLELQQLVLPDTAPLVGNTLAEADLRRRWKVGVVAVRRGDTIFPNPEADFAFSGGDVLVILGTRSALDDFETVCRAAATAEV
jgi:voltage-gated potassium channel